MIEIKPDALYRPGEVAEYLRCGKSLVYRLAKEGGLQSVRIGCGQGGMRFLGSDVLSFVESRKPKTPEPARRMNYPLLGL